MLLRMNYVVVFCSDMARSIAFYRDKMGFPVKRWSDKWTELHTGPVTLALHLTATSRGDKWKPGAFESGQAQPSFEVLDLDRFYEEKKSLGIEFLQPPTILENQPKMAVLLDPDGMPICVTQAGS